MRSPKETTSREIRRLGPVPALDGLRGVAVLLVMVSHSPVVVPNEIAGIVLSDYVQGGFLGVDLFFVLSGFLITALLLREQSNHGGVRFRSFYGRRALRLLPALYVLLVVHALYARAAGLSWPNEVMTIKWALVYASNWQIVYHFFTIASGLGHLWSLAIEEQFYLVWPAVLILFLGIRRNGRMVTVVLVGAIALIAVHRYLIWSGGGNLLTLYIRTDTRADSLLVGALLSVTVGAAGDTDPWSRPRRMGGNRVPRGLRGLLGPRERNPLRGRLHGLRGGGSHLDPRDDRKRLDREPAAVLRSPAPRGTGLVRALPLALAIFGAVAQEGSGWPTLTRVTVAFGLTIAFTALSWNLVERPALRWKRRLAR